MLLVCLLAPSAATAATASQADERVATVRVPEEAGAINRELSGLIAAERQHRLAFEVDGRVVSPSLEMGALIRQGDPVIVLDTRTAAANLDLARAGLAFAQADLELQQAQHQRLAANHAKQLVADADLDIALAGLERARAAYLQAEARQTAYITSEHRVNQVYTTDAERFWTPEALDQLARRLDPNQFFRIHRSSLINLDAEFEIEPWEDGRLKIRFESGAHLTAARGPAQELRDRFSF